MPNCSENIDGYHITFSLPPKQLSLSVKHLLVCKNHMQVTTYHFQMSTDNFQCPKTLFRCARAILTCPRAIFRYWQTIFRYQQTIFSCQHTIIRYRQTISDCLTGFRGPYLGMWRLKECLQNSIDRLCTHWNCLSTPKYGMLTTEYGLLVPEFTFTRVAYPWHFFLLCYHHRLCVLHIYQQALLRTFIFYHIH